MKKSIFVAIAMCLLLTGCGSTVTKTTRDVKVIPIGVTSYEPIPLPEEVSVIKSPVYTKDNAVGSCPLSSGELTEIYDAEEILSDEEIYELIAKDAGFNFLKINYYDVSFLTHGFCTLVGYALDDIVYASLTDAAPFDEGDIHWCIGTRDDNVFEVDTDNYGNITYVFAETSDDNIKAFDKWRNDIVPLHDENTWYN